MGLGLVGIIAFPVEVSLCENDWRFRSKCGFFLQVEMLEITKGFRNERSSCGESENVRCRARTRGGLVGGLTWTLGAPEG